MKAKSLIKWLKRRSVIEPIFGNLKSDIRLERNLLKSNDEDHINALIAACRFNLRKLYAVFLLPRSGGFPKTFVLIENKLLFERRRNN